MSNAGVSQLRLTTSSELQCVLKLCAVLYGNGLVLLPFADLYDFALFKPCHIPGNSSTRSLPLISCTTPVDCHNRVSAQQSSCAGHNCDASTLPSPCMSYSSLSRCASLVNTTCLFVSSISPAKNTSSRIAYTCTRQPHPSQHPSTRHHIPCKS
jgi:hypothetical protein